MALHSATTSPASRTVIPQNGLSVSYLESCDRSDILTLIKSPNPDSQLSVSAKIRQLKNYFQYSRHLIHPCILRPSRLIERDNSVEALRVYKEAGGWRQLAIRDLVKSPESILSQIADAVDFLHRKRYVHRDLKLENFLIDVAGRILLNDLEFICREGEPTDVTLFGAREYMPERETRGTGIRRTLDFYTLGASIEAALKAAPDSRATSTSALHDLAKRLKESHVTGRITTIAQILTACGIEYKSAANGVAYHVLSSMDRCRAESDLRHAVMESLSPTAGVIGLLPELDDIFTSAKWDWKTIRSLLRWLARSEVAASELHWRVTVGPPELGEFLADANAEAEPVRKLRAALSSTQLTVSGIRALRRISRDYPAQSLVLASESLQPRKAHHENSQIQYLLLGLVMHLQSRLGERALAIETIETLLQSRFATGLRRARLLSLLARYRMSLSIFEGVPATARECRRLAMKLNLPRRIIEADVARIWTIAVKRSASLAVRIIDQQIIQPRVLSDTRMSHYLRYYRANCLNLKRDFRSAEVELHDLRTAIDSALHPQEGFLVNSLLGMLVLKSDHCRESMRLLSDAMTSAPKTRTFSFGPVYFALATCHLLLAQYDDAQRMFDIFLGLGWRKYSSLHYAKWLGNCGWLAQRKGEFDLARMYYDSALEYPMSNAERSDYLVNYAELCLHTGKIDEYRQFAQNANSLLPSESIRWFDIQCMELTERALYENKVDVDAIRELINQLVDNSLYHEAAKLLFFAVCRDEGSSESEYSNLLKTIQKVAPAGEVPLLEIIENLLSHGDNLSAISAKLTATGNAISTLYYAEVWRSLGVTCAKRGNLNLARAFFDQALELHSANGNDLLCEGIKARLSKMDSMGDNSAQIVRLYDKINSILSLSDSEESRLDGALRSIVQETGAERAAVVLKRLDEGEPYIPAYINIATDERDDVKEISLQTIDESISSNRRLSIDNALTNPLTSEFGSVAKYRVKSIESLPFTTKSGQRGALYLAHHGIDGFFKNIDPNLLQAQATFIGLVCDMVHTAPTPVNHPLGESGGMKRTLITRNANMLKLLSQVERVAQANISILFLGETGVGKDLVAAYVHEKSRRAKGPYKVINCAAIPDDQVEYELFGAAEKAYTDVKKRMGLIRAADGGTLFLDEVGELSMRAQAKLLRAIECQNFNPGGSDDIVETDVRFLYGTNRNLEDMANAGEFRKDFLYRLQSLTILIPPLRERKDDIDILIDHFAKEFRLVDNAGVVRISDSAREALNRYWWPGNVRELRNEIQGLAALYPYETITPRHLNSHLQQTYAAPRRKRSDKLERKRYEELLQLSKGNIAEVARITGEPYNTVRSRLQRFGLA